MDIWFVVYRWEFELCEGIVVWIEILLWNKIVCWWLVVDLGGCRKREIEFRGEVKVEVEVFCSEVGIVVGCCWIGEVRGSWNY